MTTPSTETLWAYAKRELPPAEMAQVQAELERSEEARAALADVEASLAVLSLLPEAPPMPEAMAKRVGAALAEKVDEEASRSFSSWWRAFFTPRFLIGVAAACALAFGAFELLRERPVDGAGGGTTPLANVTPPAPLPTVPEVRPSKPVKATVASARKAKSGAGALTKAQVLESGASVSTEAGGSLWLRLPDGTKAGLTGATDVQLARLEENALTLDLARGSVAMVVPHREDRLLTVRAGEVEVKDLGTRFLVSRELAKVVVAVEEGSVEVRTPKVTHVVTAGRAVAWHEGELDDYQWPSAAPSTPPPPPGTVKVEPATPPIAQPDPSTPPVAQPEDEDVEPASVNPEEEWAAPPPGIASAPVNVPPPPPPVDAPPDQVVTVQPPSGQPAGQPARRQRRGLGFSLKSIEENLRELERQAHVPFVPIGSSSRELQARTVMRLADVGNCELALEQADRWLSEPAGDAVEEAPLRRMVLQQKVRCLNHLGRTAEALEVQKLLVP
jgi:ferric-dicitrate binding protein FerR (iron transport regulator)